jgi:hypothetical protein
MTFINSKYEDDISQLQLNKNRKYISSILKMEANLQTKSVLNQRAAI